MNENQQEQEARKIWRLIKWAFLPFGASVFLFLLAWWPFILSWKGSVPSILSWDRLGAWGDREAELATLRDSWREQAWTNNLPTVLKVSPPVVSQTYLPTNNAASIQMNFSKSDVLCKLLEADREEIKFWQDKFFTISFWINAAILAILAFIVKECLIKEKPSAPKGAPNTKYAGTRIIAAMVCFGLCIFYLIFVDTAEKAMLTNDHDLRGIQIALGLTQNDWYLQDQAIYRMDYTTDPDKTLASFGIIGHRFMAYFVWFNVFLVIVSIWFLFLASYLRPIPRREIWSICLKLAIEDWKNLNETVKNWIERQQGRKI